ncbi:MAG: ABC transporter ATP-binding protein [Leptospiraceae bacterium]|nr:ABC transporter ATP-binding protein [Leptospiraceae bacterium]MCZ8344889.1 ABC transporter ATP-binding protein [Leptospiraceae bacterium]
MTSNLRQNPILSIKNVSKSYENGFKALNNINLQIKNGEIVAILGSNGAGKTTLISIICGIVSMSLGEVLVAGENILDNFRSVRSKIGIVPQELTVHEFESVWSTVKFTRGLYGKKPNPSYLESLLKSLSLWEKKDQRIMTLSGGMKRRVLIAKALSHEPSILFLDEPTAGVDVELRKDMWRIVSDLRVKGVTIILTTHYIEEAEEIADRIAIMRKGEMILIEDKKTLMQKLGKKELTLELMKSLKSIPASLQKHKLELSSDGLQLRYQFDSQKSDKGILNLLDDLKTSKINYKDINTKQSSLEEIFVELIKESK